MPNRAVLAGGAVMLRSLLALCAGVIGCGGGAGASPPRDTPARVAPSAAANDQLPAYPVIWSRQLPDELTLEVTSLQVDSVTGDLVLGGILMTSAQLAGARIELTGSNDGVVVRFDSRDGAQIWVSHVAGSRLARVVETAGDGEGNTLFVGEFSGQLGGSFLPPAKTVVPIVGVIDGATGQRSWERDFGPDASTAVPRAQGRRIEAGVIETFISASVLSSYELAVALGELGFVVVELSDGGMIVGGSTGVGYHLTRWGARRTLAWTRDDLEPMSIATDDAGGVYITGVVLADHRDSDRTETPRQIVAALDPRDGATVWEVVLEPEPGQEPHHVVAVVEAQLIVVTADSARMGDTEATAIQDATVEVQMLDLDGTIRATYSIDDTAPTSVETPGGLYAVRGAGADRELVKLGPCPVERCSLAAR